MWLDEKLWCVITPVPVGYTEFCYIVDDVVTVSNKHPTTTDGSRNWRHIHGPPLRSRSAASAKLLSLQQRVSKSMDQLADSIHDFVVGRSTGTATTPAQGTTRRHVAQRTSDARKKNKDWVTGESGETLKKVKRKKVMHSGDKHLSDDDDGDDNGGLPLHHGDARAMLERGRRCMSRKEKKTLMTVTLRVIVGCALVYIAYVCYLQIRR